LIAEEQSIYEIATRMPKDARVLFTTYKLNRYFFEKTIFRTFRKAVLPLVLVDYSEYQVMLREQSASTLADTKYLIEPIKISGTFHPKLIVAVTDDLVKVVVSSANLTPQAYTANLELVTSISLQLDNSDEATTQLILELTDFLSALSHYISSAPHRRQLNLIREKMAANISSKANNSSNHSGIHLLHNMKSSILDQVEEIIKSSDDPGIDQIIICSPFFSQDPIFYGDFNKRFEKSAIAFIIKQDETDIPTSIFNKRMHQSPNLPIFYEIISKRKLHAKYLVFRSKARTYVLSGSANFTSSALAKSTRDNGGNIELCLLNIYDHLSGTDLDFIRKFFGSKVQLARIPLNEIRTEKHTFAAEEISCFRILEARISENKLAIKLDRKIVSSHIVIKVERIGREIVVGGLNGDEIIIDLDENDLISMTASSTVQLRVSSDGGVTQNSDLRLIYNPQYFPTSYSFLNGIFGEDKISFFRLLKSLASLPTLQQEEIGPIIENLAAGNFFGKSGYDAEEQLAQLRNLLLEGKIKPMPYSPGSQITDIIRREESRHESRLKNAIENRNTEQANVVFMSFYDVCKLIILQVYNEYVNVNELSKIRDYIEKICLSKGNYLDLLLEQNKRNFVADLNLIYHIICMMFIIDYLQKNSKNFQSNYGNPSGRNRVKDVFDETFNDALSKLFKTFPKFKIKKDDIRRHLKSYQEDIIESLPIEIESLQESIERMKERLSTRSDKLNQNCISFLSFD
jgi:HKD family nuclease